MCGKGVERALWNNIIPLSGYLLWAHHPVLLVSERSVRQNSPLKRGLFWRIGGRERSNWRYNRLGGKRRCSRTWLIRGKPVLCEISFSGLCRRPQWYKRKHLYTLSAKVVQMKTGVPHNWDRHFFFLIKSKGTIHHHNGKVMTSILPSMVSLYESLFGARLPRTQISRTMTYRDTKGTLPCGWVLLGLHNLPWQRDSYIICGSKIIIIRSSWEAYSMYSSSDLWTRALLIKHTQRASLYVICLKLRRIQSGKASGFSAQMFLTPQMSLKSYSPLGPGVLMPDAKRENGAFSQRLKKTKKGQFSPLSR